MPVITATIGTDSAKTYYIDNNALVSTVWTEDCTIVGTEATSGEDQKCSAVQGYTSPVKTDGPAFNHNSAGYYTQGHLHLATAMSIATSNGGVTIGFSDLNAASLMSAEAWLSHQNTQSGSIGFAPDGWLSTQNNQWSIELGSVTADEIALYIGVGDYSTIFTGNASNSVTIKSANGAYDLSGVWFGDQNADTSYTNLSNISFPTVAQVALNFKGIGLPEQTRTKLVYLMSNISGSSAHDLSCNTSVCTLPAACASSSHESFLDQVFVVQFGHETNFVSVTLRSLTTDNLLTGFCDIHISQTDKIIFGSMWLQNFVAYWNDATLSLQVSSKTQAAHISAAARPTDATNTSTLVSLPVVLNVELSGESGMLATIEAELDSLGITSFLFSFISPTISTYASNCKYSKTGNPCSEKPNYATEYYVVQNSTLYGVQAQVDGFSYYFNFASSPICYQTTQGLLCTQTSQFYEVGEIVENTWNQMSKAFSGIVGLAPNSPIWNFISTQNLTEGFYYQVVLSSSLEQSTITLNAGSPTVSGPSITVAATDTQYYELSQFGFGTANLTTSTKSFQLFANSTTLITADFEGIGLPELQYFQFQNLLAIATQGAGQCSQENQGICAFQGSCSQYPDLLEYSFFIQFTGDSNYILLPLQSVMSNVTTVHGEFCNIYVQNNGQFILGVGFLKSFAFTQANGNITTLSVNPFAAYSPYLGNQTLTEAATSAFVITPVSASLVNPDQFPPLFQTILQGVPQNLMIDFQSYYTFVWSVDCGQYTFGNFYIGSCSNFPTFLNTTYQPNDHNLTDDLTRIVSEGFDSQSYQQITELSTCLSCPQLLKTVNVVAQVMKDDWLLGQQVEAVGTLGYGLFSPNWAQFFDPETNSVQYSVALGNNGLASSGVTFGGSTVGLETETSYIANTKNFEDQGPNNDNIMAIFNTPFFNFGLVYQTEGIDTSSYFEPLCQFCTVRFQLNFKGLGLPDLIWDQFYFLLETVTNFQAVCSDFNCVLPGQCSSYNLDAFVFQMSLNQSSTDYFNVPLSTFYQDNANTGNCDISIQKFTNTNIIILGSMFFRTFAGTFTNQFTATYYNIEQVSVDLYINVANTSAYIGNQTLPTGVNPFYSNVPTSSNITLQVDVDPLTMSASVFAQIGNGYVNQFLVSFTNSEIQTYDQFCQAENEPDEFYFYSLSCSLYPNFANNYFYSSRACQSYGVSQIMDGYQTQGCLFQNQSICLLASSSKFCNNNFTLFDVREIFSNNWNYGSPAGAGIIGLGSGSPIWSIFNITTAATYYQVQFQNVTDWSFVNASVPVLTGNTITLSGTPIMSASDSELVVIAAADTNSYLLSEFSFGITDLNAGTISAHSILNSNQSLYGNNTNMTVITLDFKGIGLPQQSYNIFVNLLAIASQGQVSCIKTTGGMCSLQGQCSNFQLWQYSFYIGFTNQSSTEYLNVPLASFAADQTVEGRETCVVYVQMLDSNLLDWQQIVIGQMFFQSFTAEFSSVATLLQMKLQVNVNALNGTAIIQEALNSSSQDAFTIVPLTLPQYEAYDFVLVGLSTNRNFKRLAYYQLDFSNDETVFWLQSCMYDYNGTPQPCYDPPTNVQNFYNPKVPAISPFQNQNFGGFQTSGSLYIDVVCFFYVSFCKSMLIHGANFISQDSWLLDQTELSGIIGLGPNSPFWNSYIDPSTGLAQYSINLNQISGMSSNIIIGSNGLTAATSAALVVTTNSTTYSLDTFGFGTVYDQSGIASSSYFSNMTTEGAPVLFSVNYYGLGLPESIYDQWAVLLTNLTKQSCTVVNNICVLPGTCIQYQNFQNYTFQMLFTGASNYIQVPILTFMEQAFGCNLYVSRLNASEVQSQQIILGIMYYWNFNGAFTNQYSLETGQMTTQTATFTFGNSVQSGSYIGNRMLPTGPNPFYTAPMPTPSSGLTAGAIIGIVIGAIVLVALIGFFVFKCWKKQSLSEEADALVYERNSETDRMNKSKSGAINDDGEL